MVELLFLKGRGKTPLTAVEQALIQGASVLLENPSLVVQLETLVETGSGWDVDIRLMALGKSLHEGQVSHKGGQRDEYNVKNPEHVLSGNPDAWRPPGMKHDSPPVAFRFGNAAVAGELPEIPLQDIKVPNYEVMRASEPELRRILLELERLRKESFLKPDLDVD